MARPLRGSRSRNLPLPFPAPGAVVSSWPLRLRVVESAHRVLQAEGVAGYFVTVKPGVWSTYTDWRRGRIQFGERMLLYSNNKRPFARMGGLRGRERLLRNPGTKLGALVLHECAHALTHRKFPAARPHGPEFYRTERELLDRYLGDIVPSLVEE